jgi:hypothetical protein
MSDNNRLITPCPVCGMIDECPHTPVRCQHDYDYSSFPEQVGVTRTCTACDRIERAVLRWETVKA